MHSLGPALSPAPPAVAASSGFRPDIQALRAVAVMAVLLYHLWPEHVPGGFVGVDVFFVISGYLITQHLVQEVNRTGTVGLAAFWGRRIRRLLPAAYLVLAASLVLLMLMPPVTWTLNLEQIRASAVYVVNWLLGFQSVDYLGSENGATMALHYWSLAVEEQFYLVWPLLILLGVLWARRSNDAAARTRRITLILVGVFVVSLALSLILTPRSPELAFFATPLRAWEFAAGGLIALALERSARIDARARAGMSWLGWGTIFASCILIDGAWAQFPGWIALVPVAGAALCLIGGDPDVRWSASPLMRARPVQWVGDYSYSLYLWHWPLIIAAPWIIGRALDWPMKVAIGVLTVLLAAATKRWIEDPVRTGAWWRKNLYRSYVFAIAGAAVLFAATSLWLLSLSSTWDRVAADDKAAAVAEEPCFGAAAIVDACDGAFDRPSDMDIAFASVDTDPELNRCQQPASGSEVVLCTAGATEKVQHTIVVVGNSHALRLVPALDLYGREHGWQVLLAAKTNCLGPVVDVDDPAVADCQEWSRNLQKTLVERGDIDAVLFASHVGAKYYLGGSSDDPAVAQAVNDGVLQTFADYRQAGIDVMVLGDVPGTRPQSAPLCVAESHDQVDPCSRSIEDAVTVNSLEEIMVDNPEAADYVALSDYVCTADRCHAVVGGLVVYSDSHHLTTAFSQSLARYLGPRIERLIAG